MIPLQKSYINTSSVSAGEVAEIAADRKTLKYTELSISYTFVPIAIETMGPINKSGLDFINGIGRRITEVTGDYREAAYLRQRVSVALQRHNAICFRGTFGPCLGND